METIPRNVLISVAGIAISSVASIQVEANQKAYPIGFQPECADPHHEFLRLGYGKSGKRKPKPATDELEIIFSGLAKIWRDSTGGFSTTARRFTHPTYKVILRLGPEVVPFILRELQQRPDWWFDALEFLTKENPTEPTDSFADAVAAWIA